MHTSSYCIVYLRDKYVCLFNTLKEGDEDIKILWSNPKGYNIWPTKEGGDLKKIMISLDIYILLTEKHTQTGEGTIWGNLKLQLETDSEVITINTLFELEQGKNVPQRK